MSGPRPFWSPRRLALALAGAAGLAVVLTIADPGVTTDEPLDVRPGRTYVETLFKRGLGFFGRSTVDAVFRDNAEHPPLGRWLLGIASIVGQPFEVVFLGGADPLGLYLHAGRLAPAAAFALLVGAVTHTTARRYGNPSGAAAGFALAVTPRVFAHAHFGALDTFIVTFWVVSLLAADRALTSRRPALALSAAGAVWSLALLTKIHAWFLIPIVFAWSIARLGTVRGLRAFAGWLATGLVLFFAGWPWLWYDPVGRLLNYLGTGVERTTIYVTYFGRVYADRDVPWHYPWFYFATTVPVGLHLLGLTGLVASWRNRRDDRFPAVVVGSLGLFLILFSTRVPVYDGERLFLMAFPLWAIVVGRGFGLLLAKTLRRNWVRSALWISLVLQMCGLVTYHPFQLSYFNAFVGGLSGADKLGLELTYWGDAVDPVLLDHLVRLVPERATVALAPTLYPGQGMASTTRTMAARGIVMKDETSASTADWLVVSRREAYLNREVRALIAGRTPVFRRSRQGVWLSAIYQLTDQEQRRRAGDPTRHP